MAFLKFVFGFCILTCLPVAIIMWRDGVDLLKILAGFSLAMIFVALVFLFANWIANQN